MAHFFREPDRRQGFLLPVDMRDWLPEGDIAHLIVDAVTLMDLSGFEATCKVGQAGQAPFAPRVLLAVLIYADSYAVRSSRVVERLCGREAGYRFSVGESVPDHTVIARQGSRMKDCDPLHGPVRTKPRLAKPRFDWPIFNGSERISVQK